jgi:hypothetical protein
MANNIQNRLVVTANSNEELVYFLSAIRGEYYDGTVRYIDFNKIIPMPEEIENTESSSKVDDAIYYYLVKTNQESLVDRILRFTFNSMDRFANFSQEELKDMFVIGKQYVEMAIKIGMIGHVLTGELNGIHMT